MDVDPRTFEMDEDWGKAGYEFIGWAHEYERVYLISNGDTTLLMSDSGNGHCHFEGEVLRATRNSEPIYKIHTFEIFKRQLQGHEMFGWYHDLDSATSAVETNACDMQARAFNYAMISRSYQGGYGLRDEELQWYTWNYTDRKWEVCDRPEECASLYFA